MDQTKSFHEFLARDWEFRMQADPLFATSTGDNRRNDRLPAISESYYAEFHAQLKTFESQLTRFKPESLSPLDRLNLEIYTRLLANEISLLEFQSYRFPISKTGGFHQYFPELYLLMPMETEQDYANYIKRLSGFKCFAEGHIEVMRAGLRDGQIPSQVTLQGVVGSIQAHIHADAALSAFNNPCAKFPASIPPARAKLLTSDCLKAIRRSVIPGYSVLLQFIQNEYLPSARSGISAAELPGGEEYYRLCIRHFTSLDLAPREIHEMGLSEVERIHRAMQAIIQEVKFQGSFKEFVHSLRTEDRFFVSTPDDLLKTTALILKRMDGELPRLFKTLPRLSYGIRAIPEYAAPGCTTAYYQPGAGDGSRAGVYYVNTYDLKSRPTFEIEALSFHESVPGHHLQLALQQELDLPHFRRFNGFTSFVEGWALYAETLGLECDFYTDPYSNFGRLSYEMWRAARLVVDTGIHAFGWSRERAIQFMEEHTCLTLLNITNEVDRYIAWPGQALAYKIGEIKIKELRQQAEKTLGSRFDLREFHEILLKNGALPLDLLESEVEHWVQKRG